MPNLTSFRNNFGTRMLFQTKQMERDHFSQVYLTYRSGKCTDDAQIQTSLSQLGFNAIGPGLTASNPLWVQSVVCSNKISSLLISEAYIVCQKLYKHLEPRTGPASSGLIWIKTVYTRDYITTTKSTFLSQVYIAVYS